MKFTLNKSYILMIGVIISRLIGLFYVFPFAKMVENQGITLFSYAYITYALFLDLSTIGIPSAILKVINKNNIENREDKNNNFIKKSLFIMFLFGIFCFCLLNAISVPYAKMILANKNRLDNNINDVIMVIRLMSISLIFIPLCAVLRGYLLGNGRYWVNSFSQILEQALRASITLIGAYYIINHTSYGIKIAVYLGVIASALAALFTFLFLLFFFKFKKKKNNIKKVKYSEILIIFKKYILPFSFYGLYFSLFSIIDSIFFNRALLKAGINNPEYYYGIYAFNIQKIIIIPVSIFLCIGQVALPKISKYFKKERYKSLDKEIRNIFSISLIILIPLCLFFIVFHDTIYSWFFSDLIGKDILKHSAILIFIFGLNGVIANTMQGLNLEKKLRNNLFIGLIIKLFTTYFFILKFKTLGAIYSTLLGNVIVILLNLYIILSSFEFIKIKKMIRNALINILIIFGIFLIVIYLRRLFNFKINNDNNNNNVLIIISIMFYLSFYLLINRFIKKTYYNNG